MKKFFLLFWVLVSLSFVSCSSPQNQNTDKCKTDLDCLANNGTCFLGKCNSSNKCTSDLECSSGTICSDGTCMNKIAACFSKKCPSGQVCKDGKCQGNVPDITPQEYCNQSSAKKCSFFYRCYSQERLRYIESILGATDEKSCARESTKLCEQLTIDGIKGGRQSFNPNNAAQCLKEYDNHSCSSKTTAPSICERASIGLRGWKQSCVVDNDCSGQNAKCFDKQCTGDITTSAFQQECSEVTVDQCKTLKCLKLKSNLQNKTGICTMSCFSHSDCGSGSECFKIGENRNLCFSKCSSDNDCINGFVCVDVGNSSGDKICLVKIP